MYICRDRPTRPRATDSGDHRSMAEQPQHECEAPAPRIPGELWQCPDCGTRWWADEVDIVDTPVVAWRLVDPSAYPE